MEPLPRIPVPWSTRWREIRTRVFPALIYLGVAGVAAWLWVSAGHGRSFLGVAEGIRTTVASPQPAALQELLVAPYQLVEAGAPVAVVIPADPRAKLDLFQTELAMARLGLEPSLAQRNALDYERLRLEIWRTRSELATARVDLQRAENQVRRQTPLFDEKLISEDVYDLSTKTRDAIEAEIREKSNAVAQIEQRLEELRPLGRPPVQSLNPPVSEWLATLALRQAATATNWGPITLTAPIAGMVSYVHRQPGENVQEGEPLLTISSLHSVRVVGYLRQPYPVQAETGMRAFLTTREWHRSRFIGRVSQVGAQVEFITNALAFVRQGALVDAGLPVIVSLPPEAKIRPGEIVEVEIEATANEGELRPTRVGEAQRVSLP